MKSIGCLFAFSTCTAGYSSLIVGQDWSDKVELRIKMGRKIHEANG